MFKTHWDLISLFIYLLCALVGMICFKGVMGSYDKSVKSVILSKSVLFLLFFWGIISTFRLVSYGIGGTDAISYVEDFKHALNPNYTDSSREGSTDFFFSGINYVLRLITDDYHVYFAIIYSLITINFTLFISKYTKNEFSVIPLFMVFYVYLRSFNTLRSIYALSLILVALYFLAGKKYWISYVFFILSIFTHKSAIIFAAVIPLCHILSYRKVRITYMLLALVVVFVSSAFIKEFFVNYTLNMDLGGSYNYYASRDNASFLTSFTEFFGQYLLGGVMIVFSGKIRKRIDSMGDEKTIRIFNILYIICMYDVAIAPFNAFMGVWRGYEFFYVARMCMWCMIIYIITYRLNQISAFFVKSIIFLCFVGWFIFRLYRSYEDSDLMPYVFEPFLNI